MMNNDNDVVGVEVKLDLEDYISFVFSSRKILLIMITILGAVYALLILSVSIVAFIRLGQIHQEVVVMTAKHLAIVVAFVGFIYLSMYYSAKKYWHSNKTVRELKYYTISNSGIDYKSESHSSNLSWDKIYKIVNSKKMISVFTSNNQAHVIPKKCIKDDEDMKKLMRIILRNFHDARR